MYVRASIGLYKSHRRGLRVGLRVYHRQNVRPNTFEVSLTAVTIHFDVNNFNIVRGRVANGQYEFIAPIKMVFDDDWTTAATRGLSGSGGAGLFPRT